jgi:adenine specific DNA methylase Mod
MNRHKNTELPQSELANELLACFPQLSPDDIAKFKAHLSERNIAEERNGYRLNFVGREYARLQAGLPSDMLICPDAEHNAMPENTQSGNVFITGDNLEALRHLQNAYARKVKMIYIDPPYNTGKEFVYNDKFELSDEKLKTALVYGDEDITRLRSIQCKSSHSAWLTFMYPRLALAKKLLTDDGVIFVSIDDNEQANLKLLMDDVFGEGNFINTIVWESNPGGDKGDFIETTKQYVLCYARVKSTNVVLGSKREQSEEEYPLADEHGKYRKGGQLEKWGNDDTIYIHPRLGYTIYYKPDSGDVNIRSDYNIDELIVNRSIEMTYMTPDAGLIANGYVPIRPRVTQSGNPGRWRIEQKTFEERLNNDGFIFEIVNGAGKIYEKDRFASTKWVKPKDFISSKYVKQNNDLAEYFSGKKIFDYPKPTLLLSYLVSISTCPSDLILDFFAGSGTTAHAMMRLNAEDGGNRRWILVQLNEPTAENSEARKAPFNFDTIDQISREHIRRAAAKIGDKSGFKHYRLIAPQAATLDKIEAFDPNLGGFEDMITPMGGHDTILTTWLIDDGYPFDTTIEEVVFDGYAAHYVGASQTLYLMTVG